MNRVGKKIANSIIAVVAMIAVAFGLAPGITGDAHAASASSTSAATKQATKQATALSALSDSDDMDSDEAAKPGKIKKLSVSQKSGNKRVYLTFRWSKSGNAEKYGVYLKKAGKWKQIKTTGKISFKYTAKPLKKYTFGVRGIRGENMGKLRTIKFKTVEAAIPY